MNKNGADSPTTYLHRGITTHIQHVFKLTAENVGADVGRASSLVFQEVVLAHQVLSQAEVGDGDSVSPVQAKTCKHDEHPLCFVGLLLIRNES